MRELPGEHERRTTELNDARKCPRMPDLGDSSQLDGASLNDQQKVAIVMLLMGKRLSAIAKKIEVDPKTLYRWRQQESFRVELERRRAELWSDAADRMRAMVHPALDVLEAELSARYDRSRYRAANAVLSHSNLRKHVPIEVSTW
jgi:transposase-like protein